MKRSQILILAYAFLLLAYLILANSSVLDRLNRKILDTQFHVLSKVNAPGTANDIVVVGIDEAALNRYREPLALWHPHLGRLFNTLAAAKPRAVIVDLILPDQSYEFIKPGIDRQLLSGILKMKKTAPLIIARNVDEKGRYRPLFTPIASIIGNNNIGLALVRADSDHVVRRLTAAINSDGSNAPTLTGSLFASLGLPTDEGIINYALNSAYQYIPLSQLDDWVRDGEQEALNSAFTDKLVFVGSVLPFIDRHHVPLPIAAWEPGNYNVPGVLIHAQSANTLLQQAVIKIVGSSWLWALSLFVTLIWWLGKRNRLIVVIFATTLLLLPLLSTYMLMQNAWLPIGGLLIILFVTVSFRLGLEGIFAWLDRKHLSASFSRYVSPQVMDDIIDGKIYPGVGGKSYNVCVLFSDIRDFTARSEGQEPNATIVLLNRYFNEMAEAIHNHDGTLDKFIGDGLMAFFGAPNMQEGSVDNAFAAAQEMLQRLDGLNRQLEGEGIAAIKIGIGLHWGEAIIGHVGSDARHEYTAIGDTVNLASRIEGLTRQLEYPLVCSAAVKEQLSVPLVALGENAVKGHTAVKVYGWRPS